MPREENSKPQTPNTKKAPTFKLQAQKAPLEIGNWNFSLSAVVLLTKADGCGTLESGIFLFRRDDSALINAKNELIIVEYEIINVKYEFINDENEFINAVPEHINVENEIIDAEKESIPGDYEHINADPDPTNVKNEGTRCGMRQTIGSDMRLYSGLAVYHLYPNRANSKSTTADPRRN